MSNISPSERLAALLKKANRGVEIKGILEPSALSLVKRCDEPLGETQTAMSIEFKIDTTEKSKDYALKLTGNRDFPVKESGSSAAAYISKRTKSVELSANTTATIGERAMMSAGKAISWIEKSGGNAGPYEKWVIDTWGKAFEDAYSQYKLLLSEGWEKEVMMDTDKPESAAYSLYNYMPMVKAEFNNFPKAYFGQNAFVPWHKYAVVLKAIGSINILASRHRTKLADIKGKSMWFIPNKIPSRTMELTDFCLDTTPFERSKVTLPKSFLLTDLDQVSKYSDWTFYETLSILRKNLKMNTEYEVSDEHTWVDELIKQSMQVRKRKIFLQNMKKLPIPINWDDISETSDMLQGGSTVSINIYERKINLDLGPSNPYTRAIDELHSTFSSTYRALRDRDDMTASLGRHIQDVYKHTGYLPVYSALHPELQESLVRVTGTSYRATKVDIKYKYAHLRAYGVIIEKHKTLENMIRHAFGGSSYSDEFSSLIRNEEGYGMFLEITQPVVSLQKLKILENQTPVMRERIISSEVKDLIDRRFTRHYKSRIILLEQRFLLDSNMKHRMARRRYKLLLKYHTNWRWDESEKKAEITWGRLSKLFEESLKNFIVKSKTSPINAITIEELKCNSEQSCYNMAATVDSQYEPEMSFESMLIILEKEILQKQNDFLLLQTKSDEGTLDKHEYERTELPGEVVEEYELNRSEDLRKIAEESARIAESLVFDQSILDLFNQQESPVAHPMAYAPLEAKLNEKGITKDEARIALGILDWNEVQSKYTVGDLSLNDICIIVQNHKLGVKITSENEGSMDDILAMFG